MAPRKKELNNPPASSEEESFFALLKRKKEDIEKVKKVQKERKELLKYYFGLFEPVEKLIIENKKKQIRKQNEIKEASRVESIKKENAAIATRINAFRSFHRKYNVFTVEEYLKKFSPEYRDDIYSDLIKGGDSFRKYIGSNVRDNFERAFESCGFDSQIGFYCHPLHDKQREVGLIMPPYELFDPPVKIKYDNKTGKKSYVYQSDKERKELYKQFMFSAMLQVIAVVYTCTDEVRKIEGESIIDSLSVVAVRGFFDDSFGKNWYYPVIRVMMTKDQYNDLYLRRVNPESLFKRLGAEMYTDLFYTDIYEKDKIDMAEELRGKRQQKNEEDFSVNY